MHVPAQHSIFNLLHWQIFDKYLFKRKKEKPLLKGLNGLYLNAILRSLGVSLVSIFIPIYILEITNSLYWIFLFFGVQFGLLLFLDYPLAKLSTLVNPDVSVAFSNLLLIIYFVCLRAAEFNPNLFIMAAIINAVRIPLYWLYYHVSFIKLGHKDSMGGEISYRSFFGKLATAAAPLIGGVIIKMSGFDVVFIIASLVIFLSTFPILFDSYNHQEKLSSFKKIYQGILNKENLIETFGFIGEGIEPYIASVFWPVFIYLNLKNYQAVGFIVSFSLFLSLLVLLIFKKHIDKREKRFFKFGLAGNAINWIVRTFATATGQILFLDTFYNLLSLFVWTPFSSIFYKKAKKRNAFDFVVKREIIIHISRLLATGLIAIIWLYTQSVFLVFLLAIIGLMLSQGLVHNKIGLKLF